MKTISTLFIALCLCSTIFILKNNKTIVSASPSTLIVSDDEFNSIQEAINNASTEILFLYVKGLTTKISSLIRV